MWSDNAPAAARRGQAAPVQWLLAHGHALLGEGLAAVLGRLGAVQRLAPEVALAQEAAAPALVVTDRHTAHRGASGPWHAWPILVVDFGLCGSEVRRLLDAGVCGCVHADAELQELDRALVALREGTQHLCPMTAAALADDVVLADLTPREAEVLHLICQGLDNKRIAQELGVALSTVKTHVHALLAKTGARTRTGIATVTLRRIAGSM